MYIIYYTFYNYIILIYKAKPCFPCSKSSY